jgi:hypothetical protein
MILNGAIGDGQGLAGGWLGDPIHLDLLGSIHPASLNIFVPGEYHLVSTAQGFHRDHILAQGGLDVLECMVNGVRAFILRTEYPGPWYRRGYTIPQPNTMFEVVATERIPRIDWGAEVTLEFNTEAPVRRIPVPAGPV